jgi:DNA-binding NarL/FixJ family response regulator
MSPIPRVQSPSGAKPRVFLVDDNRQFLDALSTMLIDDFEVVGAATDARQALETMGDTSPDIVILDVEMPGVDGFETLRALKQSPLRATPTVFLSMHDADEFVTEAFRCGAQGYVVKSRVSRDLVSALDQALLGRAFVPSLTALSHVGSKGGHAIQLHRGAESLLDGIAGFFELALRRGDATCVIATKEVREGLTDCLRARGWDVGGTSGHKRYLAVDAHDALNRFMQNGLPDPTCLAEIAREMDQYRLAVGEGTPPRLTIFGNMVTLLCAEGNVKAMLALENLWTTLTEGLPVLTLCGYPTSCLHSHSPTVWSDVSAAHRTVTHAADV